MAAPGAPPEATIISVVEYQRPVTMLDFQREITAADFQRAFEFTQEDPVLLAPDGVEPYELTITTTPAVDPSDWVASFDGGVTYHAATVIGGRSTWLVAGYAAASPGAAVAVLTSSTIPQVKHAENPNVYVRHAPAITLH